MEQKKLKQYIYTSNSFNSPAGNNTPGKEEGPKPVPSVAVLGDNFIMV